MESYMRPEGTDAHYMIPLVPLPMMVFGMMAAFMFGAMFGAMMGRRRQMMMHGGYGKPWMMHGGMRGHHHHGEGSPACCCDPHSDWPKSEVPPMEP